MTIQALSDLAGRVITVSSPCPKSGPLLTAHVRNWKILGIGRRGRLADLVQIIVRPQRFRTYRQANPRTTRQGSDNVGGP